MIPNIEYQSLITVDVQRIREDVILRQMVIRDSSSNHLRASSVAWEPLTWLDMLVIGMTHDIIGGVYVVDVCKN